MCSACSKKAVSIVRDFLLYRVQRCPDPVDETHLFALSAAEPPKMERMGRSVTGFLCLAAVCALCASLQGADERSIMPIAAWIPPPPKGNPPSSALSSRLAAKWLSARLYMPTSVLEVPLQTNTSVQASSSVVAMAVPVSHQVQHHVFTSANSSSPDHVDRSLISPPKARRRVPYFSASRESSHPSIFYADRAAAAAQAVEKAVKMAQSEKKEAFVRKGIQDFQSHLLRRTLM